MIRIVGLSATLPTYLEVCYLLTLTIMYIRLSQHSALIK